MEQTMAELILTDGEKAAETWFELPDDVVGMLTKYSAARLRAECAARDKAWLLACSMTIIEYARRAGGERLVQTVNGYSYAGTEFGDWKITVERIRSHGTKAA
jgi:hypothetical protein